MGLFPTGVLFIEVNKIGFLTFFDMLSCHKLTKATQNLPRELSSHQRGTRSFQGFNNDMLGVYIMGPTLGHKASFAKPIMATDK